MKMENAYMEQLSRSEMVKQMKRKNRFKNKSVKAYNQSKKDMTSVIDVKDMNMLENQDLKSFQLRIVFASFLFLLFLGMKEKGLEFHDFTYHKVIEVISDNSGMEGAKDFTEEFVITTFNSLH